MTKPMGARCNLDCSYCYYVSKSDQHPPSRWQGLAPELLERYVAQNCAQPLAEIPFAWQGGEPTLAGLEFFRRAVALQRTYQRPGTRIVNALQTNGTLLDDEWCRFLHEHGFLVGISIDGPEHLHDAQRLDRGGKGTWKKVMKAIDRLRAHAVEYNTLTTVTRTNQGHGAQVYRFLRTISNFPQFIPVVERLDREGGDAGPTGLGGLTDFSVDAHAYGEFLVAVFDEWAKRDVGKVFLQFVETMASQLVGRPAAICVHAETCGRAVLLEHDGSLYSCDHYVYPAYRLGNLSDQDLPEMIDSPVQRRFGDAKRDALTAQCRSCPVLRFCNGGCPKHRVALSRTGEPGQDYLCPGYERFFTYAEAPLWRILGMA